MTIQSSSPFKNRLSFTGSVCRLAAMAGLASVELRRLLGAGASCSRISLQHFIECGVLESLAGERGAAGQELVKDDPERVQVGAGVDVDGVEGCLFRGHVQGGSHHGIEAGEQGVL